LPYFALKFQQYMENFTFEGKIRQNHKYIEYKNACLPTMENKLLFILTYLKGNDLQERIAEMFGMSQPKANLWIHLLHCVLNQALKEADVLPARDTDSLKLHFDNLAEETTPEVEVIELEAESLETTGDVEVIELEAESLKTTELESTVLETTGDVEVIELEAESLETTELESTVLETTGDVEVLELKSEIQEITAKIDVNEKEVKALETAVEVETIADANMELIQLFLHDGTERPINRPLDDATQENYYSGKQKQHTLKNILLGDLDGYVHFLSDTCEGKKHDKKIADEVGYILPEGSYLGQDTGFQGFEIPSVNIIQPKKKPRGGELTEDEKERNRSISKVRVRIEHTIGGVKRYRIVKDKLRNWKCNFRDLVMETCCGLHNFRLGFRPWSYEMAVI